jgi:hypothetical protein
MPRGRKPKGTEPAAVVQPSKKTGGGSKKPLTPLVETIDGTLAHQVCSPQRLRKIAESQPGLGDARRFHLSPGAAAKQLEITSLGLEVLNWKPIDLNNIEHVRIRVAEFFTLCAQRNLRPPLTGLALALGMDRNNLWKIRNNAIERASSVSLVLNNLPSEVIRYIQMVYALFEMNWEGYALQGDVNPVMLIFMGKNFYGMSDTGPKTLEERQDTQRRSFEAIKAAVEGGLVDIANATDAVLQRSEED